MFFGGVLVLVLLFACLPDSHITYLTVVSQRCFEFIINAVVRSFDKAKYKHTIKDLNLYLIVPIL